MFQPGRQTFVGELNRYNVDRQTDRQVQSRSKKFATVSGTKGRETGRQRDKRGSQTSKNRDKQREKY